MFRRCDGCPARRRSTDEPEHGSAVRSCYAWSPEQSLLSCHSTSRLGDSRHWMEKSPRRLRRRWETTGPGPRCDQPACHDLRCVDMAKPLLLAACLLAILV